MNSHENFIAQAAIPPAGVTGLTLLGVGLPDWVLLGTAIYTVIATFVLVRDKIYRPWKEKRDGSIRKGPR